MDLKPVPSSMHDKGYWWNLLEYECSKVALHVHGLQNVMLCQNELKNEHIIADKDT